MRTSILLLAALLAAVPARAHEGHDHGPATPPPATTLAPRGESASPDFELVVVAEPAKLVLYLDRFATNEPVAGATIEVASGPHRVQPKQTSPGTYEAPATWLEPGKRFDLVVSVDAAGVLDLLPVTLDLSAADGANAAGSASRDGLRDRLVHALPWAAVGTLVAVVLAWLLRRRRRAAGAAIGVVVTAIAAGLAPEIQAHEGHDHGAAPPAPVAGRPSRLPDGSVFVPKPAQRVLGVRTVQAVTQRTHETFELNGHVTVDPNGAGRVMSPQPGRIEPGPGGLPHLGRQVARGEVLAYVVPTVSSLDAANQRSQLAGLAAELDLAEKRRARLAQLEGSVPQREIEAAANAVDSLKSRLAAASGGLGTRIALAAPVSGRVSVVAATAGQVVDGREVLFEIVDPGRLMVEALAYDARVPGRIAAANGVTGDGRSIALIPVGYGATLREHAVPMVFRLAPEAAKTGGLAVGQPLRVLARTAQAVEAITVPVESVVREGPGGAAVWVHAAAERFVPRPVRVSPLDGRVVVVHEGLEPNQRVVTQGATLLGQIR